MTSVAPILDAVRRRTSIAQLRQACPIYLVAIGAANQNAFSRLGDPQILASLILDHPGLTIFADDSKVFGA